MESQAHHFCQDNQPMKSRSPLVSTPLSVKSTPGDVCPFYINSENLNSDLHTGMPGTLSTFMPFSFESLNKLLVKV